MPELLESNAEDLIEVLTQKRYAEFMQQIDKLNPIDVADLFSS